MNAHTELFPDERPFESAQSEQSFATQIDALRRHGAPSAARLVPLLSVNHPVYNGRSTNSLNRMRAYVMAAFHDTGLPGEGIPYAVEILDTSYRPILVGAAARAVRGLAAPDARIADYLLRSIYNIWQNDQPVSYEAYEVKWPLKNYSTALSEILTSITWMGVSAQHLLPELETLRSAYKKRFNPHIRGAIDSCIEALTQLSGGPQKSCCSSAPLISCAALPDKAKLDISAVELEDQNGDKMKWGEYFHGQPAVVAFFYASCMNPRKCVQTIHNLAEIHKQILGSDLKGQVKLAAITYDAQQDSSAALKQYGQSKGVRFGLDIKMFRVPTQFENVIKRFNLGVNYAGSQVSDHRIELYLLDLKGQISCKFLRVQAKPKKVIAELGRLTRSGP